MKFIILFSLFSLSAQAADCISQAGNFALGLKLKGALTYYMFGDGEEKLSVEDVCKSEKANAEWTEARDSKVKIIKIIKNDFKTKGKTSAEFLYDLDDVPEKKEMTDSDICPKVEKQINKETDNAASDCAGSEASIRNLSRTNFMGMSFEQACKLMAPKFKKEHEDRKNCDDNKSKKDDVVQREAPGEEIAPADDGAPEVKTLVLKPKSRDQVKDERPSKVRSSSGVSRQ